MNDSVRHLNINLFISLYVVFYSPCICAMCLVQFALTVAV